MINHEPVRSIDRVPVNDDQRIRTDFFCTLCNSIFVILLLIISIAVYNNSQLVKMSLPNDSQGNICGYDAAHNYTILYYPNIRDPLKRSCVAKCPRKNDKKVDCFPTNQTSCSSLLPVQTDTQFEATRIGLFCFPTDSSQKQFLLQNIGISKRYHFMGIYDALWRSFIVSAVLAIIFVALVQYFPTKVVPWTIAIGGIFSLIFGSLVMLFTTGNIIIRVIFLLVAIGLAIACGFTLYKEERMRQIFIYARLIQVSTVILKENLLTLLYVPLFIGFLFILLVLAGFEVLAAWSFSSFVFQENYPFYELKGFGSTVLHFLIFVEFVWGLCFLKEAGNFLGNLANFCVSGVATQWYFYRKNRRGEIRVERPFLNLFKFHWGSVLGCAFLTATMYIFDYILDFFFNNDTNVKEDYVYYESLSEEKKYYESRGCQDFLNLCRSQTMSYINLISIPYCNAARYCEQLSTSSHFFDFSQSTSRTYRLAAHILITSIVIFLSVLTVKSYSGQSDIDSILYIALMSLFTITFFIGLHGDMAEGLLISAFIEEGYSMDNTGEHKLMIPEQIMKDVYDDDMKEIYNNKKINDLLF